MLSKDHDKRYEVQKQGEGVYLIAWHDHTPIGHFLLRWSGPQDAPVRTYLDVTKTAYLEAGATHGAYQRKGVATALIRKAERLAKEHGCTYIGLEVGSTDNPDAKRPKLAISHEISQIIPTLVSREKRRSPDNKIPS